jgi:DNA-binding phage protein
MITLNRSQDWNQGLAKDLQDRAFAQAFILAAIEENIPIQTILNKVIHAYGLQKFATEIDMSSAHLAKAFNPSESLTQQTANHLLRPLGLCLSVIPIDQNQIDQCKVS